MEETKLSADLENPKLSTRSSKTSLLWPDTQLIHTDQYQLIN